MFEKELEEYVRKIRHDVINSDGAEPEERFYNEIKFRQAYLAGAELGYNNAFVEADKNLKAIVTDFNKANEQLTKAKNLLTRFIMGSVYFNGKETDLVEEAEQFLRELEE